MESSHDRLKMLPVNGVTPEGWLKDQMTLVNELQKKLGSSSALLSDGKWTGGELLPRYLRGLCLLAASLSDKQLLEKAESFMSAILDSAGPGGDLGGEHVGLAAKLEAVKAVLTYHELTSDEKALSALRKFFKNQYNTLSVTPMWYDGRARLPEELPAVIAVGGEETPIWLKELAVKLTRLSCDWQRIADRFPYKHPFSRTISASAAKRVVRTVKTAEEAVGKRRARLFSSSKADAEWRKPSHRVVVETDGVNLAKAVKYPCIYDKFFGYAGRESLSLRLAGALERYHGNATGMFAANGKLAGPLPTGGMDVECATELLESLGEVLAATGECACADLMEEITFNVIGAAALSDMSAVRDVLPTNRVRSSTETATDRYPYGDAYAVGVPSRGALAMLAAYPLFLRSVCMVRENELNFFSYAPCTVKADVGSSSIRIKLDTGYPFRNTVVFRVEEAEGDVSLRLNFRVPRRTSMQLISGGQVVATGEHGISVKCILRTGSTFMLKFNIPLTASYNRDGTVSLFKGSLLMASRPGEELFFDSPDKRTVCARPTGKWAFAPVLAKRGGKPTLVTNERTVVSPLTQRPLTHSAPPFELKVLCRNTIGWECDEDGLPTIPGNLRFAEEASERTFVPFCCTAVGIAHFPVCHSKAE